MCIHYAGANIHDKTLKECLEHPLFMTYQEAQPFNKNYLEPCPMLENPDILRSLVSKTAAHNTDMMSPEDCDHLCSKCDSYTKEWQPIADKLWASNHPDYKR